MKPKDKLKAIAQTRVFWIVVGSLLTAAGINVPPAVLEALVMAGLAVSGAIAFFAETLRTASDR